MIPEGGKRKRSGRLSSRDISLRKSTRRSQGKFMLEIIEKLTSIIRLQTEIIDLAITLLLQHVSTEDETLGEILTQREFVKALQTEIEADPLKDEGLPF